MTGWSLPIKIPSLERHSRLIPSSQAVHAMAMLKRIYLYDYCVLGGVLSLRGSTDIFVTVLGSVKFPSL